MNIIEAVNLMDKKRQVKRITDTDIIILKIDNFVNVKKFINVKTNLPYNLSVDDIKSMDWEVNND